MNLNALLWQTQPIMLGFGWLTLKQAQDALRTGRLDEAHRLLTSPALANHRKACDLLPTLMRALVERGEKHLRMDDAASAWGDLLKAEQLGITDNAPVRLRQALTRLGLAEVKAQLEAGEPARATESIARMRQHAVRQPELDPLEQAAKDWLIANECAERGEFAQALQILERVRRAVTLPTAALDRQQRACQEQQERFAPLVLQLHEAAQRENWQEVLNLAQQLLALAPQHVEARRLRSQAWRAIEPPTQVSQPSPRGRSGEEETPRQQLLLWIDGVGGFLVCMDNAVTLGQATQDTLADIPLFADISRKHARLQRDSEGYLLEAQRPVQVNGT